MTYGGNGLTMTTQHLLKIAPAILSAVFGIAGLMKLTGTAYEVEHFAAWGFPGYAVYLVGAAELLGGLAMLYRPLRGIAAAGLFFIMLGAIGTHALHAEVSGLLAPSAMGLIALAVAYEYLRQGSIGRAIQTSRIARFAELATVPAMVSESHGRATVSNNASPQSTHEQTHVRSHDGWYPVSIDLPVWFP